MNNGIDNIDCKVDKMLNKKWLQDGFNSLQHIAVLSELLFQ